MGHFKQNRLTTKYTSRKTEKEFHQTQAKLSKFAAIFAGATSGIATIAAIISATKDKPQNTWDSWALFALLTGLICYHAHNTTQKHLKQANKAHKQMRKAQRAYIKDRKQK